MANVIDHLQSLQFECFLTENESKLSHLRTCSHALTFSACAQATYLVSVLRDARLIDVKHSCSGGQVEAKDSSFCVGIIGCGRFGRQLANSLLSYGEIQPSNLKVSTRRPELLVDLASQGVTCTNDNVAVASTVSVLFICCLPTQLPLVASQLNGNINEHTIVFSVVTAVPVSRLKRLLSHSSILRPEMETNLSQRTLERSSSWDCLKDFQSALGSTDAVEMTCPLSFHKAESIVVTREQFAEVLVHAVASFLVQTQLSSKQKLSVINALLLGHTKQTSIDCLFSSDDFDGMLETGTSIDLVQLVTSEVPTAVGRKLQSNSIIRRAFVDRYCDAFQQHVRWAAKTAAGADCVTGAAARKKRLDSLL